MTPLIYANLPDRLVDLIHSLYRNILECIGHLIDALCYSINGLPSLHRLLGNGSLHHTAYTLNTSVQMLHL